MAVLLVLNEFVKHTASNSERVNGKEQRKWEVDSKATSNPELPASIRNDRGSLIMRPAKHHQIQSFQHLAGMTGIAGVGGY